MSRAVVGCRMAPYDCRAVPLALRVQARRLSPPAPISPASGRRWSLDPGAFDRTSAGATGCARLPRWCGDRRAHTPEACRLDPLSREGEPPRRARATRKNPRKQDRYPGSFFRVSYHIARRGDNYARLRSALASAVPVQTLLGRLCCLFNSASQSTVRSLCIELHAEA